MEIKVASGVISYMQNQESDLEFWSCQAYALFIWTRESNCYCYCFSFGATPDGAQGYSWL